MFGKMRAHPRRPGIAFRPRHGGGEIAHTFGIAINAEKRFQILIPPGAEDQPLGGKCRGFHRGFLAQSAKRISP